MVSARGRRKRARELQKWHEAGGKAHKDKRNGATEMIAGRDDLFCSLIFTEMEEEANTERHDSNIAILPGLVAHVGMKFRNSDEAWAFWLSHGGQKGFEDRKRDATST